MGSPDLWLVGFQQQEQGWREDHAQTPTIRLGAIQPPSSFTSLHFSTLQHFTRVAAQIAFLLTENSKQGSRMSAVAVDLLHLEEKRLSRIN